MNATFCLLPTLALRRTACRAVALVAIAAALASCSFSREVAPKRTFLLDPPVPAAAAMRKPWVLRVGAVNVASPFRGKAFVYRQSELRYDADFYDEFFVTPAAMLSEATARSLIAANVFRRVIAPGAAAADDSDYVLDGFVSEFYGDAREPSKAVAVLAVTFYLSSANMTVPSVLWSREYRQRVPATESSPEALARAWNTALAAVLADLARDLAAVELPTK